MADTISRRTVARGHLRLVPTGMRTELSTPGAWVAELEAFIGWLRASGRPKSTIHMRTYHLRRFAVQSCPRPYDVTLDLLVGHLSMHDWSPNTRHSVRSSLRSFYGWAHTTGRMPSNPAALMPSIKTPMGRPRPAADEALAHAYAVATPRVLMMVRLGAEAGLRAGEISRVRTSDLSGGRDAWTLRVLGKGARIRDVPVANGLAAVILSHPEGYLFPGQVEGHLSAAYVTKLVSQVLPEGVTAHMLRHRFASRAYKGSGHNIRAVQQLLGHSSVATTQVYTAVDDDDLRAAALSAA